MNQRLRFRLGQARRDFQVWSRTREERKKAWERFWRDWARYLEMSPPDRRPAYRNLWPQVGEDVGETSVEPIYFYQDAWAFEHIVREGPALHVDVGSHHKFAALLSKVVPVTMVDIRPLPVNLDSLKFKEGSILDLPFENASLPSVSSICVIEHIGLGRYGDVLDPFGTEKALEELKRVIAPAGYLYISVPLDTVTRTYFNAHRAFSEGEILKLCEPFEVVERMYIYGMESVKEKRHSPGTGCYKLRRRA